MERADHDESLAELLRHAAGQLRRRSLAAMAPFDVTPWQARALRTLLRTGPLRMSALAELLGVTARSITEVVDALEERALVRREPDPSDRRATIVCATAEGERVGAAIGQARRADSDQYFAALDARDRAELARILRSLRRPTGGAASGGDGAATGGAGRPAG